MSNAKKKRVSLRGSKGTIQRVLKLIQPSRGLVPVSYTHLTLPTTERV